MAESLRISTITNDDDEEPEEKEGTPIKWTNIMFLPFHPTWQLIVLLAVLTKCTFGPFSSIYSVYCSDKWQSNTILFMIKIFYSYICDPIYAIDTFLFIVHRQVTDEAAKREFFPKSPFFFLLDMLSLIPFFHLMTSELCPQIDIYPNIMAFNEILIAYRIFDYFNMVKTHSPWKLFVGYTINLLVYVNAVTCFIMLVTDEDLCENCNGGPYDWRFYIMSKINVTSHDHNLHLYCSAIVMSLTIHKLADDTQPSNYVEFIVATLLMSFGYLLITVLVLPKLFSEGVIRNRRICTFHPRVKRIIEETKRRNPSPSAHLSVERFYSLIWTKRNGVTSIAEIIAGLPRNLRLNITQDLYWPIFHHSPILRNTSVAYKRWICEKISSDYKLPGEHFFTGKNSQTNLYYLKSGIVQFISSEDSISATLSVASGTIFGDISFFVPPINRKVFVRCLTYCEVLSISRATILMSLHKFPEDRHKILGLAKERIKHAQTLYSCKNNIRGLDRADDEGLAWIKRRWWDINNIIKVWKKKIKEQKRCNITPEEANYHCVKYIGQLVLGANVELQRKSIFVKVGWPWILAPHSVFCDIWNNIVKTNVFLVLILMPPYLASTVIEVKISEIFTYLLYFTDVIYVADVIVSLITAVERNGSLETSIVRIMFQRFKSSFFLLDLISIPWIEYFVVMAGHPEFYYFSQFNRMLKTYMLFFNRYKRIWKKDKDPINRVMIRIGLTHFWFGYVLGYFMFIFVKFVPDLSVRYLFGEELCFENPNNSLNASCEAENAVFSILTSWMFETLFPDNEPGSIPEVGVAMAIMTIFFLMHLYTKSRFISMMYLKYREIINYYYFVSNLKTHYLRSKIHPTLLERLDRYLVCNWKYYNGIDILHPNLLSEVPYDIYSKLHGELAEDIISKFEGFIGSDKGLIKEMAREAKFLILPKETVLLAFGLHLKNVVWIAHGVVKYEFYDDEGIKQIKYIPPGKMLSRNTVFMKKSLKSCIAATDVEVLYISLIDYFKIIEHYPDESYYLKKIKKEFIANIEAAYQLSVRKYKDVQKKIHDGTSHPVLNQSVAPKWSFFTNMYNIFKCYRTNPESKYIRYWMTFRVISVAMSIMVSALQGGSGAMIRPYLRVVVHLCDVITFCDIGLKLFLPYYDERGLIISNVRMCVSHYISRGFLLDVIGGLPWDLIVNEISTNLKQNESLLLISFFEFAHIYILIGYFNYIADVPNVNISFVMILKWQIVVFIVMIGVSYFFVNMCIDFTWDNNFNLVNMERRNSCWVPSYLKLDKYPTTWQLHHVFAESLSLAQCGFLMINLGKFRVEEDTFELSFVFLFLGVLYWYIMGYCQTLLVLHYRGNTLFQHGVSQLKKFLSAERVSKDVIDRTVNHFIYIWIRTKGINVQTLMNKRIGTVFRQDLGYFFYKKTFHAVDSLLRAGDQLERELAGNTYQVHFLPGEDIIREMELSSVIFIIHRGRVNVSKNGEKIATLTKGCIFGQLEGLKLRPVAITVTAIDHVDVLNLTVQQWQDMINDDIRYNIAENETSSYDFMALKEVCPETPYNTTAYILRERKTIKLPMMMEPTSASSNNWYTYWLFCVWLVGPVLSAILVLLIQALPNIFTGTVLWMLILLDILQFAHLVSEFFTMQVVVVNDKCVKQYVSMRKLFSGWFCLDILSLIIPLLTQFTGVLDFQLARLWRIHSIYLFQRHFCRNFETRAAPQLVKFFLVILLLHAFTCGWIIIACRSKKDSAFPFKLPAVEVYNNTNLDFTEWIHPDLRKDGCSRCVKMRTGGNKEIMGFVVPKSWQADYIIAFTYIVITQTHTNIDPVIPLTLAQIYYKIFMTFILWLVEMWLVSMCISAVYTYFREMYYYDFHVSNLIINLKQNGLSPTFLQTVKTYTKLLWHRQRGNWLPEITQLAPECLMEDIMSALYLHHFLNFPIFKVLPLYFLRQLTKKLRRIVVFPGNMIIQEGDIFPCIYFIHEGEVEKWYTDLRGENRFVTVLTVNGYFGLVPGLFPDVPYKFSYCTRTVVDLVYLLHGDWQELLSSYPDLKHQIYTAAEKLKNK